MAAIMMVVGCASVSEEYGAQSVTSPDGRVVLTFDLNSEGEPTYTMAFANEQIIAPSTLSIETSRGEFDDDMRIVNIEHTTLREVWEPVWGQFSEIENHYNEMVVTLENEKRESLDITFRIFNDGVALRYTLHGEGACDIYDEETEFRMASDCFAHWMAGSDDDAEFNYMHTPLSGINAETMQQSAGRVKDIMECGVATPVAMKSPAGNYIALHEAALWHYPGMALDFDAKELKFTTELSGDKEVKSCVELPFSTPWRTIIVGDRVGSLVESSMVLNLNEPCKLEDTSWIKPMKYVGVWWEMHLKVSIWDMEGKYPHCATTENVKKYIDFAAENGFGGNRFLANWQQKHM